ncbi:tudor domain-containing protein 1-like [Chironomus tepperi]|uniref:tudor domain-containing protein 1-like n=1 Tax=Chironomus tepperi TaxID=113505 RepID=UPI00391F485E
MIKVNSNITQNDTVVGTLSITSSFNDDTFDDGLGDTIKQIQHSFEAIENLKNLRISESFEVVPLKKACHDIITSKPEKFFSMSNLKTHEWPKAKNIKVKLQTIVQPPNIIAFVEDKKLIANFYEFMESEIEKYRPCISEDYREYLPKTNEIVLGQYNGSWYRAIVLDSDPKGVIVFFIDYGNMELLLTDEILPISNEYFINKLSFEVCSRQFIVDNVQEELDAKQQEILESRSMMITNIRVDDKGLTHCEIFGF